MDRNAYQLKTIVNAPFLTFYVEDVNKNLIATTEFSLPKKYIIEQITDENQIKKEGVFFISDFSKREIEIMQEQEYKYDILIEDVEAYYVDLLKDKSPSQELKNATCSSAGGGSGGYSAPVTPTNFNLGTMGGYLKYTEMLAELDAMVAQYPNLITAKAPISTFLTIENRPIYQVKISDNPNTNEAEPKILYTAIHHAREPMSLMETIFFMWYVLENEGVNIFVKTLVACMIERKEEK